MPTAVPKAVHPTANRRHHLQYVTHKGDRAVPSDLHIPRVGGWLPQNSKTLQNWVGDLVKHVDENPKAFVPVIVDFQRLIEGDATIYMLFHEMFEQIPLKPPYFQDPTGARQVRDYMHMLSLFNEILSRAPTFNESGLVGFPINAIIDWPMGTPSGITAFLNDKVNAMFKKMLNEWAVYLDSTESAYVLNETSSGWLGTAAMQAMKAASNGGPLWTFKDTFICQSDAKHYGYKTWDNFFTRKFRPGVRPIAAPQDQNVIVNACESAPYFIKHNVQKYDKFWLKATTYSLYHMLANDALAPQFEHGTVYQAFLSSTSYHRWHAPVSGKIVKAYVQPGTYYSESLAYGFPFSTLKNGVGGNGTTPAATNPSENPTGPDPAAPNDSQSYLTEVATRGLIFIQADNPAIGLMCFMAVGMAEVSTCDITVHVGQHVSKGDQLGTFHFGGSTHCLIFRPQVKLVFDMHGQTDIGLNSKNIPINSRIATVVGTDNEVVLPPSVPTEN